MNAEALQPDDRESIVRVMLTFDRAASDFLGDCERRGFRPTTITSYQRTYDEFADRLPIDQDVAKVGTDEVRRYLNTKSRLARGTRATIESHLASLFKWLVTEGKIAKDPMVPIVRTRRLPSEDLDVVTVSTAEVRRMLEAARGWPERLCLGVLVYTGCRRRAAAQLRLSDYDQARRLLRFREKGGKTIWKPVPDELDNLIRAAITASVYQDSDYLIPNRGPRPLMAAGERSTRVVWDLVKEIAARAGVERVHVHALRAAFAVYYLETHERDTVALKELMGHRSIATTEVYLRKLDKTAQMERVRDLSWVVATAGDSEGLETPHIAGNRFEEDGGVGAGGFEPPQGADALPERPPHEHLADALADEARLAADPPLRLLQGLLADRPVE